MKNVAIVTGASSGVGLALSVTLAERGYHCVATMRNLGKRDRLLAAAEAAHVTLDLQQLDVQDSESIKRCVRDVMDETGRVDLLVNNAGAGMLRASEHASEEDVQWCLDVNFTGVVRCTNAVLPHMREARKGHIINVSSVGGLVGQPFNEIYCAAKFAVEGYSEALASYVEPAFGIHFTVVEPGGIQSEFANSVLAKLQADGGMPDDAYKPVFEAYLGNAQKRLADGKVAYQTAAEVADVIADCAQMARPPIRVRTSDWAENLCQLKTGLDPDGRGLQAKVIGDFLPGLPVAES